jgi:hypothetical protein
MKKSIGTNPEEIIRICENLKKSGHIFTAYFLKKDGTYRKMNCRGGVKIGVNGLGLKYNPSDYGLVCVWDIKKRAHRMIDASTIKLLAGEKTQYLIPERLLNI